MSPTYSTRLGSRHAENGLNLRNRRALRTTDSEDKAMAPAAIMGSSNPTAAMGMAAVL
jgi:hypothetical protein